MHALPANMQRNINKIVTTQNYHYYAMKDSAKGRMTVVGRSSVSVAINEPGKCLSNTEEQESLSRKRQRKTNVSIIYFLEFISQFIQK